MFTRPTKCIASVTVTSFLLHFSLFLWQLHGVYHNHLHINLPIFENYGGRLQFLTMITSYTMCVGAGFAAIVDIIQLVTGSLEEKRPSKDGFPSNSSTLISIRDEVMSFWVYNLGIFVSVLFWGIAAVDLESIHPEETNVIMPLFGWHNHFLHTLPLIIANMQVLYVNYNFPSISKALISALVFSVGYLAWMYKCKTMNGSWAYDIMDKFDQSQFVIFIVACVVFFLILSLIGRKVGCIRWNEDKKDQILISLEKKGD